MDNIEEKADKGKEDFMKSGEWDITRDILHQRIDNLFDQPDAPKKKRISKRIWILISLLILLVLAGLFYLSRLASSPSSTPDQAQIFATYVDPFPNILSGSFRGDSSDENAPRIDMSAYDKADYSAVIKSIPDQISPEESLYAGIAHLYGENPTSAEKYLKDVLFNEEAANIHDAAQWYLALAYIRANQIDLAKESLEKINNQPNHFKFAEANELIKMLE